MINILHINGPIWMRFMAYYRHIIGLRWKKLTEFQFLSKFSIIWKGPNIKMFISNFFIQLFFKISKFSLPVSSKCCKLVVIITWSWISSWYVDKSWRKKDFQKISSHRILELSNVWHRPDRNQKSVNRKVEEKNCLSKLCHNFINWPWYQS
jgi:hypothetical protein